MSNDNSMPWKTGAITITKCHDTEKTSSFTRMCEFKHTHTHFSSALLCTFIMLAPAVSMVVNIVYRIFDISVIAHLIFAIDTEQRQRDATQTGEEKNSIIYLIHAFIWMVVWVCGSHFPSRPDINLSVLTMSINPHSALLLCTQFTLLHANIKWATVCGTHKQQKKKPRKNGNENEIERTREREGDRYYFSFLFGFVCARLNCFWFATR